MDVTLPNGKTITGIPEGTTKEAIKAKAIAAGMATPADFGDKTASTFLEPAATVASSIVAEPVAGLAGIVSAVTGGDGADTVRRVREGMTYTPKTPEGQAGLASLGETLAPVGDAMESAERALGDIGYDIAGPAGGAAGASLPTAMLEALGLASLKGAKNSSKAAQSSREARIMADSAPSADDIKARAGGIYDDLAQMDVTVKPEAFQGVARRAKAKAKAKGLDPILTPKAQRALDVLEERAQVPMSLGEIEQTRRIVKAATDTLNDTETSISKIVSGEIDSFLDSLTPAKIERGAGENIGSKYKAARELWSRTKKAELVSDAIKEAGSQASGYENGLRIQFRQLLRNKKKMLGFTDAEKAALRKVVDGTRGANMAKLIGKFGLSESQATNFIGAAVGSGFGAAAFGPAGFFGVPAVGQVSKIIAQRITAKNAKMAEALIRAGRDSKKITAAYLANTPKRSRDASDLTALYLASGADVAPVLNSSSDLVSDAALFATALAPGASLPDNSQ